MVIGLILLLLGIEALAAFVAVAYDAEMSAAAADRRARERVRAYVTPAPAVDLDEYRCRASRDEWPARLTPTDLAAAAQPWRTALVAGMGWATSEYRHGRIPMPWPELAARLRREAILSEVTGEFRAIVHASLFELAAAAIAPAPRTEVDA